MKDDKSLDGPVDPDEFLRALLAVSSEDAAEVREEADTKAKPEAKVELPGDDDPDVVAGMKRLRELRKNEGSIPDA